MSAGVWAPHQPYTVAAIYAETMERAAFQVTAQSADHAEDVARLRAGAPLLVAGVYEGHILAHDAADRPADR